MHRLRLAVLALSLLCCGGAGYALWSQAGAQRIARQPDALLLLSALESPPRMVPSPAFFDMQAQLARCDDLLRSAGAQLYGEVVLGNLAQSCLELADGALRRVPSLSMAHLVRAGALARQGDTDQALGALATARRTAPFEGWQAARRLRFALSLNAPAAQDLLHADALWMARSRPMQDQLARLYWSNEAYRDPIRQALETAPGNHQQGFVGAVRRNAPQVAP